MNAGEEPARAPWAPGQPLAGRTADWSREIAAMAEDRRAREAAAAGPSAEPPRPRHARGHVFLAAVARGAGTVLIALGTFVVAAGTAVRGMGVRHLP